MAPRWESAAVGAVGAAVLVVVAAGGGVAGRFLRALLVLGLTALAEGGLRLGGTARRLTALAVGLVGLIVGIGIGVRHLTVAGATLLGAVGAVALVAGVALLAAATAALVRALPGWWRLTTLPIALALVAVVVFPLTVAVMATNVPPTDVGDADPADVGLDAETVTFPAADGTELVGWWVPSRDGAAVALLHGATSTRAAVLDHAAVLADHGVGVLAYDARGHGDSEGDAMALGWWGEDDLAGAVTWLADQPGVDPDRIGAVGLSMGGEQALGALGADPRLAAVVAEGATSRVRGDRAWLPTHLGGQLQRLVDRVTYAATDLLTAASPPATMRASVARAAPRPALVIAAGDVADEVDAARHIAEGAPSSVEVWVVEGAGHTEGLDTAPEEWTDRVTGFLDTHLGG
jgi:dienelactone hydrolase